MEAAETARNKGQRPFPALEGEWFGVILPLQRPQPAPAPGVLSRAAQPEGRPVPGLCSAFRVSLRSAGEEPSAEGRGEVRGG